MTASSGFLLVLLGFGFLIFIHELGHFLAAKWAGIRADGFAIGMGPCLASYRKGIGFCFGSADAKVVRQHGKRPIEMGDAERIRNGLGETEYSLRALPLGGYVRMLGQEDGNPGATSSEARSFSTAPIPKRAVVILAGIAANLALAVVLFLVAFLAGVRFPAPTVGDVEVGSPAALAEPADPTHSIGLRPGDQVLSIDGSEVKTFIDLRVASAMAKPETPMSIEVLRGGERMVYTATPTKNASSGLLSIGVDPARGSTLASEPPEVVIDALAEIDLNLAKNGIGPGSRLTILDGKPITTFAELAAAARGSNGAPLIATWTNVDGTLGATREIALTPVLNFESLRAADAGQASTGVDAGIIGLAPLSRVRLIVPGSRNLEILRAGDVFLRVGTVYGPRVSEVMKTFRATPNASIPALVLRDGVEVAVELKTDSEGRVGVYLEPAFDLPRLARAVDRVSIATADSDLAPTPSTDSFDTPAKALEIVPLGMIVSMNGQPIADFRALRDALFSLANATPAETAIDVRFELRDPSPEASTTVATTTLTSDDLARIRTLEFSFPIPETLFDPEFTVLSAGGDPLRAITMGFRQTVVMIEQVFLTIDRVSRGSVGVDQLQGPVGILHTGTQVASEGPMFMVFFLAMISVNLAVVNLLPIPIADGGLFLFLVYEKLRGRPPSIAFQNAAAMAGIALVAGLFLLTFYNDIGRLFS